MINKLKSLVTQYVRDPTSVEIWVDAGNVTQEYPSLYLKERIFINITEMTRSYQSILGAIRVWYEENNGGLTEEELEKGMKFEVEILKENDAFMQVELNIRSRLMMSQDDQGMINASHCR